jgi:hypothetical protein
MRLGVGNGGFKITDTHSKSAGMTLQNTRGIFVACWSAKAKIIMSYSGTISHHIMFLTLVFFGQFAMCK